MNVENEIGKGRATLEDKNAKIEAHNDFIHQERQERKVDDKLLYDVRKIWEKFKKTEKKISF